MADERNIRCTCPCCRVRGLMGPVMLITVGVIFLAREYTRYDFRDLWPILLIAAGAVRVMQAIVSRSGHVSS